VAVPELEDVEERLLQIMEDEFEVVVDDDSSVEVATQILTLWGECLAGNFAGVQKLQEEYARRGSRGAETIRAAVVDGNESVDEEEEEEWSGLSDDEDEDVEMGDAPPQLVERRERVEPEVDEEGFTKVAGRRRGR
jgi:pre-rRNA-processing protein TSR2